MHSTLKSQPWSNWSTDKTTNSIVQPRKDFTAESSVDYFSNPRQHKWQAVKTGSTVLKSGSYNFINGLIRAVGFTQERFKSGRLDKAEANSSQVLSAF
ncbi:hypothetical protein H1R20_g11588, partial [Candolleomyces eurysporus]